MATTRETGNVGEGVAVKFLEHKGFTVVARNWKRKLGEIDIVAKKDGIWRIVEVKSVRKMPEAFSRVTRKGVMPEELAHSYKLQKVARLAELFAAENKIKDQIQVDVVAVYLNHETKRAVCRLYEQVL